MTNFEELLDRAFGLISIEELSPELLHDIKSLVGSESTKVEQSELDGHIKINGVDVPVVDLAKRAQEIQAAVTFETDMLTVNALGGIGANEDLNGLGFQDIFKKLLYPYVAPSVGANSNPNGGTFEFGNRQTVTNIRAVVTKKSEKITKVEALNGSTVLGTKTEGDGITNGNGGNFDFPVSIEVAANKNFSVRVTDATNKTFTANTGTFSFFYPYYYGKCAAAATSLTEDDIKAMTKKVEGKGNKSHTFTTNNERFVIAYPKAHGNLKSIIDPNGFDITASFAKAEITITGLDGTAQAYFVYIGSANTNTNFVVKFNY